MRRTLLVGGPKASWRTWEKEHRRDADLLILDPADTFHGFPATFRLLRGDRPLWTRLYGSLDPKRAPHVILTALAEGLARAEGDVMVRLFAYRNTPLLRQTVALAVAILRPDRVVVAEGTELDLDGFPSGPEVITLEPAFPPMVQDAMRKAQWMKLLEHVHPHRIELSRVTLEGSRLGSGQRFLPDERHRLGLETAVYAEQAGRALMIVGDEIEEGQIARALDLTHATRAVVVSPRAYDGRLVSFARANGEEFGHGYIEHVDWDDATLVCQNTAIPPAPAQIVRIGALAIDAKGTERGEARPWEI